MTVRNLTEPKFTLGLDLGDMKPEQLEQDLSTIVECLQVILRALQAHNEGLRTLTKEISSLNQTIRQHFKPPDQAGRLRG